MNRFGDKTRKLTALLCADAHVLFVSVETGLAATWRRAAIGCVWAIKSRPDVGAGFGFRASRGAIYELLVLAGACARCCKIKEYSSLRFLADCRYYLLTVLVFSTNEILVGTYNFFKPIRSNTSMLWYNLTQIDLVMGVSSIKSNQIEISSFSFDYN